MTDTVEPGKKKKQIIIAVVTLGLSAVILAYTYAPEKKFNSSKKFFSDDDGKTWYADDANLLPPHQHDGREANLAIVFNYAGGSKEFCGYLMRFPPDVKKQIEDAAKAGASKTPPQSAGLIAYGTEISLQAEVKAPMKNGPWVKMNSREGGTVMSVRAPDGSALDSVLP